MTWTSLLSSTAFDGVKTDVMTAGTGLLGVALIVVAIGVLYRVFTK